MSVRTNPRRRSAKTGPRYHLTRTAALEVSSLLHDEPGLADENLLFEAYDDLYFPSLAPAPADCIALQLDAFERLELRNMIRTHGYRIAERTRVVLSRKFVEALG